MPREKTTGVAPDALVALTESAAARLAHVSHRQVRYWADTGLVSPNVGAREGARLYAFNDVLALLVAARLRKNFSLQLIRKIVRRLHDQGYEHPLSELVFAVDGSQIIFQHADGSWEGARRPGQIVFFHTVELNPLRDRIRESVASRRAPELRGATVRRRKVLGSKPVFAGTRTPVKSVFPYLERGYSTKRILEAFPHLTDADVRLARAQLRESGAA